MDSFEIRKHGELIETIIAHEFQMKGKNAIFSIFGEVQTVIALEPGMRVDRVYEPQDPKIYPEEIARRFLERMRGADKAQDDPKSTLIEFPR